MNELNLNELVMYQELINLQQENEKLKEKAQRLEDNYDRIYNENCKLRENHNITDINLLDENEKLRERIEYLEKSISRKEERIIELQQERISYTNEYVEELIKENEILDTKINKYIEQKDEWVELIQKFKVQQQEFIKYLEKRYKDVTNVIGSYGSNTDVLYGKKDILEEILEKYKEIIGDVEDE